MSKKITTDKEVYYIAYSDNKIHAGFSGIGRELKTGMPNLEEYEDKYEWEDRLNELKYDWSKEEREHYFDEE